MVAALSAWHEDHGRAANALAGVEALPAHVYVEAYSVLTRLPAGLAVAGEEAAAVLTQRFPAKALALPARRRARLLSECAEAGVVGGAAYDALIGLEAAANDEGLLTLDVRAQDTYRRLGVRFELI